MNGDKINQYDRDNVLRAIFDQSVQFIGLMTLDGILIDANRTAIKFSGAKEEDVIGKPFWETPWWTHSKELQKKLKDSVKKVAKGEAVRFEATHPDAEGKLHTVDFSLKPVKDEKGDVIYMIPEGRDIAEIKLAEKELKESEEKNKAILNTVPYGIAEINNEARFEYNNNAYFNLVGYKPEELLGRKVTDFFPSKESVEQFNAWFDSIKEKEIVPYPWVGKIKRKDGMVVDLQSDWQYKKDEKGKITGFIIVSTDITEKKKIEDALKENEEKYRSLFENSQAGIYRSKLDGSAILDVNNKFVEIFGYAGKEEVIGKPSAIVYPDIKVRQDMVRHLQEGKGLLVNYETRFVKKDGSEISCLMSVKSFPERGIIEGTIVDITDRKRMDQDLHEKVKEIEKMNKLMVGRELKMIELKEEIARLKDEKND